MTRTINVNQQHLLEQLAGGSVNHQCTIEALIDILIDKKVFTEEEFVKYQMHHLEHSADEHSAELLGINKGRLHKEQKIKHPVGCFICRQILQMVPLLLFFVDNKMGDE
ncbi:hypothetical protein MOD11_18095 [Bacillus atrophaeus]|uniref:hypothetical protein n=1 Tax=Bacillus atrophaeus TaxID=1452 RepID=UPI00227F8FBE|nr:hypothetical protein [Bacillus atrophaeus]MCY8523197.1 hypothetical protein [Bacillus atrophaeus]